MRTRSPAANKAFPTCPSCTASTTRPPYFFCAYCRILRKHSSYEGAWSYGVDGARFNRRVSFLIHPSRDLVTTTYPIVHSLCLRCSVCFPAASMRFVVPNEQPAPIAYRYLSHPVRFTLAGDDFDVLDIFVVKPCLAHVHKLSRSGAASGPVLG